MPEKSQNTNSEPHPKVEKAIEIFKKILNKIGIEKHSQALIIDEGLSEFLNLKKPRANHKLNHEGVYLDIDTTTFYQKPITDKISQLVKIFEFSDVERKTSAPDFSMDEGFLTCTLKFNRIPDSLLQKLQEANITSKVSDYYVNGDNERVDYKFTGGKNLSYIHQIDFKVGFNYQNI